MESSVLRYFCITFVLLLNMSKAWLFVFNNEVLFIANVKAFHTKKFKK